jgi:DNA polymerase elongation subunit (family B)
MDKYYKNNKIQIDSEKDDLEFQIIEWHEQDELTGDDETEDTDDSNSPIEKKCRENYTIRCFGVTAEGKSVTCKINNFTPFYFIKVDDNFKMSQKALFLKYVRESFVMSKKGDNGWINGYYADSLIKCDLIERKDLFGFRNGRKFKFVRLVFNNKEAMSKSKYIFKKPIVISGINKQPKKYKLYESNFDPFLRFCHIKNLLTAGWVKLPKGRYDLTGISCTTQIEVELDYNDIQRVEKQDIANFLQASWDIETYSFDGAFPDPNKKIVDKSGAVIYPNVIYQIATTFKNYKDKDMMVKHLLTLKKCAPIKPGEDQVNVIVEECKTEKDLIKRWIDLISKMDPDIMYTYNGDTFDCMYLFERAKLYGLEEYLKTKLSRVSDIPTIIKKETFSSSAYGDSDFLRFYIPGRLNYDLLIHYKRGMKKYPSYKLDFIANEILKQGKHDVSAKDIFKFYEEGDPEKIRHIGRYCIQDTELLQRLVDKQLILITIIQLANVTYVPIGFLVTRGQTIKVFSQILRKSREMGFLVPHTNFNEDSFSCIVKTKIPHEYDLSDINKYIEINCGTTQIESIDIKPDNDTISPIIIKKKLLINAKITEIINENEFIVLSDTEIFKSYYNISFTVNKGKIYTITQLSPSDDAIDDSFTGATVLEAKPGLYKENIAVLDFASLYPTIIISRNLCYSTMVMDPRYLGFEGVKYEKMKWDDKVEYLLKHKCSSIVKDKVCGKQAFFDVSDNESRAHIQKEIFDLNELLNELDDKKEISAMKLKIRAKEKKLANNELSDTRRYYCRVHDPLKPRPESEKFQKKDVSYDYDIVQPTKDAQGNLVNKGVIPALLEELYAERKKVKKLMAKASEENNKLLEDILNSTQLAIKVSLNSTYGFLGRKQGSLILKELGAIVTYTGRRLIEQSKTYAEGMFLEEIKNKQLAKHKIRTNNELIENMSNKEIKIILEQFKV